MPFVKPTYAATYDPDQLKLLQSIYDELYSTLKIDSHDVVYKDYLAKAILKLYDGGVKTHNEIVELIKEIEYISGNTDELLDTHYLKESDEVKKTPISRLLIDNN